MMIAWLCVGDVLLRCVLFMQSVLTGRRKITPVKSVRAVVRDYELSFEYNGLSFIEPGFGTLRKAKNACAHGVLHRCELWFCFVLFCFVEDRQVGDW